MKTTTGVSGGALQFAGESFVRLPDASGAGGRARPVMRVRKPGRVRVNAAIRPSCKPSYVRVTRRR